ncbi:hypothetical protein MTP99_003524 [Tenebrio molitor]|nr:hypothetical protein MTP99_003524 [Tenebrio molitor]
MIQKDGQWQWLQTSSRLELEKTSLLTVRLHERHVSTAWAISVVLGGNRRPTTGAGRSTVREAEEIRIYQQRVHTCIESRRN